MQLYDTAKKEKVEFKPIKDGKVKMYVCGPTVYDDAHLGHARSAIVFDLLRRVLLELGYKVEFMKNFTDIDDKIINKIKTTGKSLKEITEYYINRYLEDMQALNVLRADFEPKATESLDAIEEIIKILLEKEVAYKTKSGDIYFDITKDRDYGRLSHQHLDEINESRVEHDEEKRNKADFALWKACRGDDDICFDSAFGKGRPGWHIECSAMIDKNLAYKNEFYAIDIHAGGMDLVFPHHENEAAQTRCSRNQSIAKYWMHNGFVNIHGEKMSKSLGNSFFIKDALKVYDGEILRFYLLSTHYRAPLNFNEEDLLTSKKRLDKLYRLKKRVGNQEVGDEDSDFKKRFLDALSDDLNISVALATVDEMIADANEYLDKSPKDSAFKRKIAANIGLINRVLGVGLMDANSYFQLGVSSEQKEKIKELIEKRSEAKKVKDFKKADEIRDELQKMGILIMDTHEGTVWEKIV